MSTLKNKCRMKLDMVKIHDFDLPTHESLLILRELSAIFYSLSFWYCPLGVPRYLFFTYDLLKETHFW